MLGYYRLKGIKIDTNRGRPLILMGSKSLCSSCLFFWYVHHFLMLNTHGNLTNYGFLGQLPHW